MKKSALFFVDFFQYLFIFFLLLNSQCFIFAKDELPKVPPDAKAPVDTLFHKPLARGIMLVYQDRFQEAVTLFDSLQQVFPDHPAPYFYLAATYQSWMSSYRFNKFQNELEENVKLAISIGNDLLKEREDDPWVNFYIGAAYGYRAFFRVRSWNFIGAYIDGKKGIGNFNKALEKEPALYDAYLGLGAYHYWRTARSGFIRVIAFWMSNKRDFGLEQIEFAMQHGRYAPEEASLALVTALYDYKKYERALEVIEDFMVLYEEQLISSLYLHGIILSHFERWPEVQETFEEILSRLENYPYPSTGYQVECKYWIAGALRGQGQLEQALSLTEEALKQGEQRNKDTELEGQFNNFDDTKDWLKELKKDVEKELEK
jgi:tetratricopeptide (TPR) repeat protein